MFSDLFELCAYDLKLLVKHSYYGVGRFIYVVHDLREIGYAMQQFVDSSLLETNYTQSCYVRHIKDNISVSNKEDNCLSVLQVLTLMITLL